MDTSDYTKPEQYGIQKQSRIELADIFREYGQQYCDSRSVPLSHRKVMHDIAVCRTASLGAHVEQCDSCGLTRISYNSCCNRHCPKCQALVKAKWMDARKAELLPVPYFHMVFTLPHEINPIVLCNKKSMVNILFKSVAETLHAFAHNPENRLGGRLGFIAILHTWDQSLREHFHLHCVIPAGALSFDGNAWISVSNNFLFPVKALSKVFRGKFTDFLNSAFLNEKLSFPGSIEHLKNREKFDQFQKTLREHEWVVYAKKPFEEPEHVLKYIARYTHRVAISNNRILDVKNGKVSFTYRDRKDKDGTKIMTLDVHEFIRRFLLHVLPDGLQKIRHYGFLANRCKKKYLSRCREIFNLSPEFPQHDEKTARELLIHLTGIDFMICPVCKEGTMKMIAKIQNHEPMIFDSS